ncbi:L-lactate dehydrogenase complex protein LldG [Hoeflea marina]|uniref:L-lactate dehydrogenase complex protein LldG n=1 Tax=Hoeflea marina TaxID=274592 RepID=A0A317PKT9_9HYPH|nr:LUD domain-containing protein [Hoeflea marina]PWW01572.1 L-lactate dehydrogenase complex protein LldG [Hoeflea marina]
MDDARSTIMQKIRTAMRVSAGDAERNATVDARLSQAPKGIVPMRGQLPQPGQVDLFEEMATRFNATVSRVAGYGQVPAEVLAYLRGHNLPAAIRVGADARLGQAGWERERTLEVLHGFSDGNDLAGVSHALSGIAETGTLALESGPDNPTTINFLPEHHIVVVRAGDIRGDMEAVWEMLRGKHGKGQMPRAFNLITGPSRSGDIEQTILLGAHGPRALHIIIVE